jgi:hypothetical protein
MVLNCFPSMQVTARSTTGPTAPSEIGFSKFPELFEGSLSSSATHPLLARQVLPGGQSGVCLLVSDSLPVIIAASLVAI